MRLTRPVLLAGAITLLLSTTRSDHAFASGQTAKAEHAVKQKGRLRTKARAFVRRAAIAVPLAAGAALAVAPAAPLTPGQRVVLGVAVAVSATAAYVVKHRPWRRLGFRRTARWQRQPWARQLREFTSIAAIDKSENEDSMASNHAEGIYAVAAGASGAASPRAFADGLVEAFIAEPTTDLTRLVEPARQKWNQTVDGNDSGSLFESVVQTQHGGQATFLGLRRGEKSWGRRTWSVFALARKGFADVEYSDTVAYRVDAGGRVLEAFPPLTSFGSNPVLATTKGDPSVQVASHTMRTGKGEFIILATDKVAEQIQATTVGGVSGFVRDLLQAPDQATFARLVGSARSQGMGDDDSTAMIIPHE
jgi:hypothetical protein